MSNLGPSIGDVHDDLIASNELAEPGNYDYVTEGGRLYAVGSFGKIRVGITLEAVPTPSGSGS